MIDFDTDEDDSDPVVAEGEEKTSAPKIDGNAQQEAAEQPQKRMPTPLEATIILARQGRKEVLPILRQRLDEHGEGYAALCAACRGYAELGRSTLGRSRSEADHHEERGLGAP